MNTIENSFEKDVSVSQDDGNEVTAQSKSQTVQKMPSQAEPTSVTKLSI